MNVDVVLQGWFDAVANAESPSRELKRIAEEVTVGQQELMNAMAPAFGIDTVTSVVSLVAPPVAYLQSLNLDADNYYQKLWELIEKSILMETDLFKKLAIGVAVTCSGMPYRKAKTITMDDVEFSDRIQALSGLIRDMNGMLDRRFSQKTEAAAAVLEVLDEAEDERDRAVLMAMLIESVKSKSAPVVSTTIQPAP